jgi:hypothetical protein
MSQVARGQYQQHCAANTHQQSVQGCRLKVTRFKRFRYTLNVFLRISFIYGLCPPVCQFNWRRIFGSNKRMKEKIEGWRKLCNGNKQIVLNIMRVSRLKRIRWTRNIALVGTLRAACRDLA